MSSDQGQMKRYETADSIKSHIEFIKTHHTTIYEINLKDNVFHPAALKPFMQEINKCKNLRKITLSRIFSALPKSTMLECFEIILTNIDAQKLIYLDLSQNALSCSFPPFFTKFLNNLTNLRVLKIDNCGLGSVGGKKLAEALAKIEDKSNLVSVDISTNKLTDSADELGKTLGCFSNLESIFMQYNNVGRDSMKIFLKSFDMHFLARLDLRDNFIDVDGCRMLGEMFVNSCISELRLSDCLIGDEGLQVFVQQANEARRYTRCQGFFYDDEDMVLDFGFNGITSEGVKYLEDFIEDKKIVELRIEGNEFGDEECLKGLICGVKKQGGQVIYREDDEEEADAIDEAVREQEVVEALEKI